MAASCNRSASRSSASRRGTTVASACRGPPRGEVVEVEGGGERTKDFAIAGAPVRITVQRGAAEGQSGDMFVELLPPQALSSGEDHVDVWLPPVSFDLALRACQPGNAARAGEPHGPVVTLEVRPDRENAATVGW